MKAYKVIISMILLLTYSLGFAHNLIPHTHHIVSEEHIVIHEDGHHHHKNNQHHSHTYTDHQHISHGNHYDEDLFDLIVCFLHNADDHQENNCDVHHYLSSKTYRILSNKLQKVFFVSPIIDLSSDKNETECFKNHIAYSFVLHDSPLLKFTSLRGPPIYS